MWNALSTSINLGGGAARPAPGFDGEYATVNLADHREMSHVTMDKMLALHRAILPKFVEAVSLGSPRGSAGVPIEHRFQRASLLRPGIVAWRCALKPGIRLLRWPINLG
jgi:hypothetical protein